MKLQEQRKLQIIFTSPQVFEQELRSPSSLLLETARRFVPADLRGWHRIVRPCPERYRRSTWCVPRVVAAIDRVVEQGESYYNVFDREWLRQLLGFYRRSDRTFSPIRLSS